MQHRNPAAHLAVALMSRPQTPAITAMWSSCPKHDGRLPGVALLVLDQICSDLCHHH